MNLEIEENNEKILLELILTKKYKLCRKISIEKSSH